MRYFLLLLIISGCSLSRPGGQSSGPISGEDTFQLTDANGSYIIKREIKLKKNRLVSRTRFYAKDGTTQLENTVAVSRVGSLKGPKGGQLAVQPEASQFRVWFEKEEYFSQAKVLKAKRKIAVSLKSPKPQWEGIKELDLPKARYVCFFSQLPECLKLQKLLIKSARKTVSVYIIWDNFPYHNELYADLNESIVTPATLTAVGQVKGEFKFNLDIGSQILFYHYDSNLNFTKMFWVAQGISMVKLGTQ